MNNRPPPAVPEPADTLAILTPRWGSPSETFIRRNLTSVLPGRTVAMSRKIFDPNWCRDVPLLSIREIPEFATDQLARVFGQWRFDRRSRALRQFLKEHHVTVAKGEWLNFAAMWFPNLRGLGIRFFAHARGYDTSAKALRNPWYRFLYRRLADMDGVIAVSHLIKQRLHETLRLDPDKIHVIPSGADIPPELPARPETEHIICLSVGRMVEKKAPLNTLKAFQGAYRACSRLRLEFIGAGPLRSACETYCREHGLSDAVVFHGSKPHAFVKERLARADIFLLHSVTAANGDEEGLPGSILEGMAYGLPVVSTRHAAIPEAVVEGETGFLVAEHDALAMGGRIADLAKQPALRRQMGEAGRQRAARLFSAEQTVRRLREVLLGVSGV